jgi:hypothetical protein
MKEILPKTILFILVALALTGCAATTTAPRTKPDAVFTMKSLSAGKKPGHYEVTCASGNQHRVVASHAEQDFQYYYPDKEYYIKYYDLEFTDLHEFAEWVCRNK